MIPIMGVDPGVRGGVAVLGSRGEILLVEGFDPSMEEKELMAILNHAVDRLLFNGGWECYFEKVGYMPGDGGKGAFTFGDITGFIRGFIKARGVVVHRVHPQIWQAKMDCLTGGDKNVSKRKAMELFPNQKITHKIADALLIAVYGQLMPPCVR